MVASTVGTTIEWYDFFLYATTAALIFPKLFFPGQDPATGVILAYGTQFVGFAARPVGVLPTYASIGIAAPLLLTLLRLVQGIAVGGEWGGSVLIAMEWGNAGRRGFMASWPQLGVPLGLLTSTALVLMMTIPGLGLFYGGMVRKKNVIATVAQSFAITCLVTVLWAVAGYSLAFATNPDPTGPSTEGVLPATGSVAALISRATGVEPYFVGKPNPLMMRAALNRLGAHSESSVMIGDRMDTDVVAGLEAGMQTVLVLTGITQAADVDRFPFRPSRVVGSIADLIDELPPH